MTFAFKLAPILVILLKVVNSYPYKDNPTLEECRDLKPSTIKDPPQIQSQRPFKIHVSDSIYENLALKVSIEALDGYPIRGIMLQARRAKCDHTHQTKPLGAFNLVPGNTALKTINCSEFSDTVINKNWTEVKGEIQLEWSNKHENYGKIYFVATVVASNKLYWTDVSSEIIRHASDKSDVGEICPSTNQQLNSGHEKLCASKLLFLYLLMCLKFYFA